MDFSLSVVTPNKKYLDTRIDFFTIVTSLGELTIYKNHLPLICKTEICKLSLNYHGVTKNFAIGAGTMYIERADKVILLVDSIEAVEEIDINRVLKEKQEAEQVLLTTKKGNIEYINAELKLKKAINRINVKGGNTNEKPR